MNPYDNPEAYDHIVWGGHRSPGTVTINGHDRQRGWDVKAAKGQTGATSTMTGEPIGEFECTFYLVRDYLNDVDEFEEWRDFQRELDASTSGPVPKAYPIYHPDLALNRFTDVAVKNVGGMMHDGKGGAIVKVQFIEYRPPKPKPAKKAASKAQASDAAGANGAGSGNDPNAAARAELDGLLQEAAVT